MIYSLDIETKCAKPGCTDGSCAHALIPHLSAITCIGIWSPTYQKVLRGDGYTSVTEYLSYWIQNHKDATFVLHNGKFDLKKLRYDGVNIPDTMWVGDTQLMAYASVDKVSYLYLEQYEAQRKEENKKLPVGFKHRDAGGLSLKTLAPYFLGVSPFWEDPTNHDSDDYVLKDCEYTYRLYEYFQKTIHPDDKTFYETYLMPWSKMLLEAELRGITIDLDLLKKKKEDALVKVAALRLQLDEMWKDAHEAYHLTEWSALQSDYNQKCNEALAKLKDPTDDKKYKTTKRYIDLFGKASAKLEKKINYDSPKQLAWLLKGYLGLDITSLKEDDKESSGKDVLNKLYNETRREDLKIFLAYREQQKLLTAFIPTYEELLDARGVIRPSFNITGTKTGRLSSSKPNAQQIPPVLQKIFVPREGYSFVYRDESYIEPRLIAYFCEEPFLCNLILRNGDFHSRNAIIMFGLECEEHEVKEKYPRERKLAKTVGLALLYGAGANRIQQTASQQGFDWSIIKCREINQRFREEYEHIYKWKEELDRTATQRPLNNLFGFRRRYQEDEIHMQAFNGLIQGSASMLVINSALQGAEEFKKIGIDARPLVFVHDAIIWEVPDTHLKQCEETIERVMTTSALNTQYGTIPLVIDGHTGKSWG